jgi:hypothetical protein
VRTLISQAYVSSVNGIDTEDGTRDLDFIASPADDPDEEERIAAFLSGADYHLTGQQLDVSFASHF